MGATCVIVLFGVLMRMVLLIEGEELQFKALVAGYRRTSSSYANDSTFAEVWDGTTWSRTGSMLRNRKDFRLARLLDGRVLAAGGDEYLPEPDLGPASYSTSSNSSEIWSPESQRWEFTGKMLEGGSFNTTRSSFEIITLRDGRVLAAGGYYPYYPSATQYIADIFPEPTSTAEVWNPVTGEWSSTGSMADGRPSQFKMVLLSDGRVLVAGGLMDTQNGFLIEQQAVTTAEVYNPKTGEFTSTGDMSFARGGTFGLSLLADGRVMAAGGGLLNSNLTRTEIWNPKNGVWSDGGTMTTQAEQLGMVSISNGTGLFATSLESTSLYNSSQPWRNLTEVWRPGNDTWASSVSLNATSLKSQISLLQDGRVMIVGALLEKSRAGNYTTLAGAPLTTEIFDPATQSAITAGALTTINASFTDVSTYTDVTSYEDPEKEAKEVITLIDVYSEFELVTL